jgi:hypothetical protein
VTVAISELADGTFAVEQPVVTPTWVDRVRGFVIRPVLEDLADPDLAPLHAELSASLARTASVLGPYLVGSGVPTP